jgi:phosphatidylglycerophosphate synthase
LPTCWSANTFTLLGNTPLYIAAFIAFYEGGQSYGVEMPSWVYYLAAAAVTTFSWFDIMDGQRARRLKCGTPIGRIVDEAGDSYQYTFVAFIMGYIVKIPPGWLCLSYGLVNLPMYTMEMRFILAGNLKITAGNGQFDIGPVELEMIFTTIFLMAAFFGTQNIEDTVNSSFKVDYLPMGDSLQVNHACCGLFVFLLVLFSLENIKDSISLNFCLCMRMLAAPAFVLAQAVTAAYLGVYTF